MAHEEQLFTLPITGTVTDWLNLNGDPTDPITAVGPNEFYKDYYSRNPIPIAVPPSERGIRSTILGIDPLTLTAEVLVTAHPLIMRAFEAWLDQFANDDALLTDNAKSVPVRPDGVVTKAQHNLDTDSLRAKQLARGKSYYVRRGQAGRQLAKG